MGSSSLSSPPAQLRVPLPVAVPSSPSHSPSTAAAVSAAASASQEERAISVESPCDLHPGFAFVAKIGVEQFCVTVPSPGVRKGDIFQIRVPASTAAASSSSSAQPRPEGWPPLSLPSAGPAQEPSSQGSVGNAPGQWKDGIFACFRHGIFHPSVWNAVCCPHILMRQVSNRLGDQGSGDAGSSSTPEATHTADTTATTPTKTATNNNTSYRNGTTLFVAACLIDFLLVAPLLESSATAASYHRGSHGAAAAAAASSDLSFFSGGGGGGGDSFLDLALQLGYGLWTIALTMLAVWSALQLRSAVKARYGIARSSPTTMCEDVVCVTCCHPCALSQVARQTTDYDAEQAACCTATGLAGSPRLSVCLLL